MRRVAALLLLLTGSVAAESVDDLVSRATLPETVVLNEVKTYLHARVPKLEVPATREAWEAQATELRQRYLDEVVLRGVPDSWTAGDVTVEYAETIETGKGYRIRKLRYEALPGMWIPALLYEPDGDATNLPGVLNVNGHYDEGKVREEEQIRCINFAKRGVVNIHPEWFRCGELNGADYDHARGAYLDASGVSMVSVFHLALKRALDILESHPRVDRSRLAMSGLSGGGWQTAVFSALDPRVAVVVPVAGHGAMGVRIDNGSDIGDLEQVPIDMLKVADYTHLTALFAPRPALLIYNEKDDCCFQAPRTLPAIYDPVLPVYRLYGAEADFQFHVNHDPGTHNYGQDNRIQFYKFVDEYLAPESDWGGEELPTEGEILPVEQTNVGIPEGNKTIVGLGIEMARAIQRPAIPATDSADLSKWKQEQRTALKALLNYAPINLHTVACGLKAAEGTLWTSYHFKSAEWTIAAAGNLPAAANASTVDLVLDDGGLPGAKERLASLAGEGRQVVAVAPLFQEGTSPKPGNAWQYSMILNATGDRSLAIQAAQLAAVCDWFKTAKGVDSVSIHTKGPESGLIALVASALHPGLIENIDLADMPSSLIDIMEARGKYNQTPSLYSFGFLKQFDFAELRALAS